MKLVPYLLLTMLLIAACSMSFGQIENYPLRDFKYRTTGYRLLRLDIDLQSNGNFRSKDSLNSTSFSGIFNTHDHIYYEKGYSRETRQQVATFNGNLSVDLSKGGDRSISTFGVGGNYEQRDWFYKPNYFFTTGFGLTLSGGGDKQKIAASTQKQSNPGGSLFLSAAIGRGRLEYIADAQTAVFIIKALQEAGKISSEVDKKIIDKLAQLIIDIKNSRVQDSRRRMIYQITQLGQFFVEQKLMTQCDPEAVAIINDNFYYGFHNELTPNTDNTWRYYRIDPRNGDNALNADFMAADFWDDGYDFSNRANYLVAFNDFMNDQFYRLTGTAYYVGFQFLGSYHFPRYSLVNSSVTVNTKGRQASLSPHIFAVYEKHIPVNLHWQKIIGAQLDLFQLRDQSKEGGKVISESHSNGGNLQLQYRMGYYPNNRTVLEGSGSLVGSYSDRFQGSIAIEAAGGYFLNYNAAIRANFRTAFPVVGGSSGFGFGLRVSVLHYFF